MFDLIISQDLFKNNCQLQGKDMRSVLLFIIVFAVLIIYVTQFCLALFDDDDEQ